MARNKRMFGQYESEDIGDSERRCVFCGEVKSITDFPKNGRNPDGTTAYRLDCKVCYNIRRKENKTKKRHSDFIGGQKRRGEAAPRLSHQEWKEAMIFFGGECAYCGGTPRRNQRLTRDHLEPVSNGGTTTLGVRRTRLRRGILTLLVGRSAAARRRRDCHIKSGKRL